ncbi:MAG: hypothetical protein JXR64_02860 [Spirochaetales bacterium]|nr:hypothetical protein [Spirochaetales bacterium]
MAKICKIQECSYPVFGKGYCKKHQYLRQDYKSYVYKKTATGELQLFELIWKERIHKSYLSGRKLEYFSVSLFAHVLPKAQNKFPKWKLNPDNIILLTEYEHHLYDNGTMSQREAYAKENDCNWTIIHNLYKELKDAYEKEFDIR